MHGRPHGVILSVLILLSACSNLPAPAQRAHQAIELAQQAQWRPLALNATPFQLQAFVPAIWQPEEVLTLYIEGDGLAWVTSHQPSNDPTPINPVALRLALAQPEGNVAYLARPCQYLAAQPECLQRYWTDARFAQEVVGAMDQAVAQLKSLAGARELVLVGYSGGAAVALLLAARRDDVRQVITVAGNLDHAAWTAHHRVSPLHRSLNPLDQRAALSTVNQLHLVGEQDRVVPPELVLAYMQAFPDTAPQRLLRVPDYDHGCCWQQGWQKLWREASQQRL